MPLSRFVVKELSIFVAREGKDGAIERPTFMRSVLVYPSLWVANSENEPDWSGFLSNPTPVTRMLTVRVANHHSIDFAAIYSWKSSSDELGFPSANRRLDG